MSTSTTSPLTASSKTRVLGLDVIRGVAVLGILLLNIVDFGWPNAAYNNPAVLYYEPSSIGPLPEKPKDEAKKDKDEWKTMADPKPDLTRLHPSATVRTAAVTSEYDVAEWATMAVFFADKMRTLFCILFGAGVIYLTQRTSDEGGRPLWLYYRRIFVLLIIGSLHAYLIWHGDILFLYAAVGLYLYPFRKLSSRTLGWVALGMFAFAVSLMWTGAAVLHHVRTHGADLERRVLAKADIAMEAQSEAKPDMSPEDFLKARGEARKAAVNSLQFADQLLLRGYLSLRSAGGGQRPEEITRKIRMYGEGSYFGMVKDRAKELFAAHLAMLTPLGLLSFGWLMILGMSLAKNGFFAGKWPIGWYRVWAFRVVPAAWIAEAFFLLADRWWPSVNTINLVLLMPLRQALIPALSLGYASMIILAIKGGYFTGLTDRLSCVGRMALSNYLAQSIICTFLFYSFGLGLFGQVPRVWLFVIVLCVWSLELWWSPRWLAVHNFGPVEWVWRGLAYRKFPPFRKNPAPSPSLIQPEGQPA